MILLEVEVIAKGSEVNGKIGNPVPFKAGQSSEPPQQAPGTNTSNAMANKPVQSKWLLIC